MKSFLFISLTIIAFIYCFQFGYIWTAYGHGGQVMGIPFALVMLGLTIWHGRTKNILRKNILFFVASYYFVALAGFSLTVELIRSTKRDYHEFLYLEPTSWVNIILLAWLGLAVISTTVSIVANLNK